MPHCANTQCDNHATHVLIEDLGVVAEPEVFLCEKHASKEGYATCVCCDGDEQNTSEGAFKPTWLKNQVNNGTCCYHP